MKIAISTDGDNVSAHFGRCPEYTLVDIEENKVISKEVIANPGHQPGFLPQFLKEKGVNVIITGGMGPRAQQLFADAKIDTILGIEGSIKDTIDKFVSGDLIGGESICSEGAGRGYGIDKSACDHEGHH
ncbi:MAG: Dinitrogenase iron-molybdenum cofactor [Actinobacteria bacterium ADurb.Bin346]|nr:MAG: Dinitrogenase iron-molybdenum cofactor [Actinobacteria bacterium ADurb.Bin346]